ncbi:MAG: helix-turn-helix domain-containing protein [Lactimicrobium massiliense]|nr:helix-turn-helix domain-containing protein [Lactimicrobium massiliense]MDD6230725.1 helix-turn-helix domain-containing protein [Lactimicrobium massiliense]MDD6726870.1 helix-turn-helix domain-containing protein [Lactimicrobium massiliense]
METRIKQAREELGMTQEQLSEKSGVSRITIISLESGNFKDVKATTMAKIAKTLGKSMDDLFSLK